MFGHVYVLVLNCHFGEGYPVGLGLVCELGAVQDQGCLFEVFGLKGKSEVDQSFVEVVG